MMGPFSQAKNWMEQAVATAPQKRSVRKGQDQFALWDKYGHGQGYKQWLKGFRSINAAHNIDVSDPNKLPGQVYV